MGFIAFWITPLFLKERRKAGTIIVNGELIKVSYVFFSEKHEVISF